MKSTRLITIAILSILSILTGCDMIDSGIDGNGDDSTNKITGSGNLVTVTKDYSGFNGIDIQSAFAVEIIKGGEYSVKIEADDNILEYVETHQSGNKIYLSLKSGNSYRNITLKAIITSPELETISANGGVAIEFSGYEAYQNLSVVLNGGSVVKGSLNIDSLSLSLNGGAFVDIFGTCKVLKVTGNGGSTLKLYDFTIENCDLTYNGGCIAYINVTGLLNVRLSGGSILKYKGNPTIGTISISGGSIIQKY